MKKWLLWALFAPAALWAGVLDTTFNPGSGANGIVEQVLPLSNGKLLICGNFTSFNGQNAAYIARLNSNGSRDTTFNAQPSYWVRNMSVQGDGKIIIGGFFKNVQGIPRSLIARLNADGSIDTTFNPGSGATDIIAGGIDGNMDPFVFWTAVQPDGKILATGNFRNYNGTGSVGIVRINPDGSRDTSFNVGQGLDSWGRHIRVQSNGQIVVAGWFQAYNGQWANRLVRINPDGSRDGSFNPYFGDRTAIYSTVGVGDKMVVAGHSLNTEGLFLREMERINADGSLDASFVGYTNEKTESLAQQGDGKIIAAGNFTAANGVRRTAIARFNPDGTLDGGWSAEIDNYIWCVTLQADGKALISGGFYNVDGVPRGGVARLLTGATGTPPPPPPAVAPILSAAANSTSQITLTWSDSATDRTGYVVERKTGAGGTYAQVATLGATARSYVNSGLAAGTQYYYRLRASRSNGTVIYSNESSATTTAPPGGGGGGASTALFVGADSNTHGTWKGVYGTEGYGVFSDQQSFPRYARVTPAGQSDWIWQYATTDVDALQKVNSTTDRIAACWYSSSTFSIDLAVTDGAKHRVTLYFLDWDVAGRNQTVQVVDGDTDAVLNTQTVANFAQGLYLTWEIGGHVKINVTPNVGNAVVSGIFFGPAGSAPPPPPPPTGTVATPTISPNGGSFSSAQSVTLATATAGAEIRYTLNGAEPTATSTLYSGAFSVNSSATVKAKAFKAGMNPSATASAAFTISTAPPPTGGGNFVFVGADTTTKGNWRGVYGGDGYNVIGTAASYPAYAQVSAVGKQDWVWNQTTTDSRALLTPSGTSRIAGCWYQPGTFTINVNFTDGATHRLALYFCDWDFAGRTQAVELIDVNTGAVVHTRSVSGFSGGQYLVWDLKGRFTIRVTMNSGPNAVVNGVFFGPAGRQL